MIIAGYIMLLVFVIFVISAMYKASVYYTAEYGKTIEANAMEWIAEAEIEDLMVAILVNNRRVKDIKIEAYETKNNKRRQIAVSSANSELSRKQRDNSQ